MTSPQHFRAGDAAEAKLDSDLHDEKLAAVAARFAAAGFAFRALPSLEDARAALAAAIRLGVEESERP